MKPYTHTVQYYETDKMGITHHSNYVRWMEEARLSFLGEIGFPYDKMEDIGIISPVVSVECEYKKTSTYGDIIDIKVTATDCNKIKLFLSYVMTNQNGDIVCEARSSHCFLNDKKLPMRLDRNYPEFYKAVMNNIEKSMS